MFVTILPALLAVPSHAAGHQALQQQLMRRVVLVQHQLVGRHLSCRAFLSAKVFPAVAAPAVSLTRALLLEELVIKTGLKLAKPPFFFLLLPACSVTYTKTFPTEVKSISQSHPASHRVSETREEAHAVFLLSRKIWLQTIEKNLW